MTRKLFWQDPYRTELDTRITSVTGNEVTVAETIFYAFSGGQESDAGTISGHRVMDARKDGLEIIYTIEDSHSLSIGEAVHMAIDWDRRYKLMRLHFAVEIVLELVYQNRAGIPKIGAHISTEKSRVDFAWDENLSALFPIIYEQANAIIQADHPIISAFSDEANQRRYWEIEGFARVACGGTHIRRTGEVGVIQLKRKNVGKGKERIEVTVDN